MQPNALLTWQNFIITKSGCYTVYSVQVINWNCTLSVHLQDGLLAGEVCAKHLSHAGDDVVKPMLAVALSR
jgi:hypothetical protein